MTETFGYAGDDGALHPRARDDVSRSFERGDERVRRGVQGARPEDNHETAGSEVAEIHLAEAGHASRHDAAEDIEPYLVPELNVEAPLQAFLDRDLGLAILGGAIPPFPVHQLLVRFQVRPVGHGEFP